MEGEPNLANLPDLDGIESHSRVKISLGRTCPDKGVSQPTNMHILISVGRVSQPANIFLIFKRAEAIIINLR